MTRRTLGLLALAALVSLVSVQALDVQSAVPREQAAAALSPDKLKRLTAELDGYVTARKLAGGVLWVGRRGQPAYLRAFGQSDVESRVPMREDTLFRIASQTKALVSTATLMLQEEGKLLIGDPVWKYLPEFRETTVAVPKTGGGYDIVKARRPITIRDLLTHTSGIGDGTGVAADRWEAAGITGWYFADRNEPIRETVSRMASLPFDAQPGERWVYGYSTDILGALIEQVSGESLDELLRSKIFEPLGMNDTHFYLPESKRDRLATVYSLGAAGHIERTPDQGGMISQGSYASGPRRSFSGGAGLVSTARDYARFLQMMLNGGELDGVRLLSRRTVELMTSNRLRSVAFNAGQGFGLGFAVLTDLGARGTPGSVGEYGWGGAYHSTYWVDPKEQMVVVYLTQLIPAGDVDDHAKVRALLYAALE